MGMQSDNIDSQCSVCNPSLQFHPRNNTRLPLDKLPHKGLSHSAYTGVEKHVFITDHVNFIHFIPLNIRIDIIVRLASQCTVTTSDTFGLVNDHYPLMLALGCAARGLCGCDGSGPSGNCNTNSSEFQEFASVDIFLTHFHPRGRVLLCGDTSAPAMVPAPCHQ